MSRAAEVVGEIEVLFYNTLVNIDEGIFYFSRAGRKMAEVFLWQPK
ncbi:hypothetical protein FACS1894211_14000 [Clostridia bacterium]|nr:hypothetical protein FACS1894211_14000 [Clostridia bacterium]